jgi:hypothetical protein
VRRGARSRFVQAAAGILVLALGASAADAQPRRPRAPREPQVFVTVAAGASTGTEATDRVEWQEHVETAVANVSYGSGARRLVGASVGVRLWRQFGAGVAFTSASHEGAAGVEGRIPHPFHYEQPRDISGETGALSHSETGLHLQVLYIVPTTGRVRLMLSAGPSRILARQDTVARVQFTEAFPFDTAAFQRADTRPLSASAPGFNAGAEAAYMFTRSLGVAGLVRFTRASIALSRPDGGRLSLDAGGVQAGAAVRVAF